MSVSPITYNGMIQRANDVGTLKQNADTKPVLDQHNIQAQQIKQEQALSHKVAKPEQKENAEHRYDAKEKGNGTYQKQQNKQKQKQKQKEYGDKVIVKGNGNNRFDIKI